ncbi:MAG: flagellin lysine-N-methylase [Selenomonadaceae bacterium]|nr:flagellin lysine-N-methylase [Selenomonadaceae bacterium]
MQTYEYYQPEYVKSFHCDRQKCSAACCRNWSRFIDKKIYKKYSHLKPKSLAKEMIRPLKKVDGRDFYKINLDENLNCPFLSDNNLCNIPQKFGEDFVPAMCIKFPRKIYNFFNFFERSLSLTCPLVTEQVLLATEPLKFEKIEVPEEIHNEFSIADTLLTPQLFEYLVPIQETAIKILQNRNFSIDQRLLILELYFDKMEEIIGDNRVLEIEKINDIYQNEDFLQKQLEQIAPLVKFDALNHVTIMLAILKFSYESVKNPTAADKNFFDIVVNSFKISGNENSGLNDFAQQYISMNDERQKFLQKFSTVFENYLVHELFTNVYPFRFFGSITQNYNALVTAYKLLEFITFSGKNFTAEDLISAINVYINNIEHNPNYFKKILEYLYKKDDPVEVMNLFLQI